MEKTNVFQFMVVRAPNSIEPKASHRNYIKDDGPSPLGRRDADLFSDRSLSMIGPMVYKKVFCENPPPDNIASGLLPPPPTAAGILEALLEMLPFFEPACPNPKVAMSFEALRDRTYITAPGRFYVLPDRLEHLQSPLISLLRGVLKVLHAPPLVPETTPAGTDQILNTSVMLGKLRAVFRGSDLVKVVFGQGNEEYTRAFTAAKRELFDTLYMLYILRRRVSVNLERIIEGLRALHVLEALAVDETVIGDLDDLKAYLSATPVIHPLFARLHRIKEPFNTLRPLGIGDLKVVKQWLCGYKAGDFAHVENVLEGESKIRVHRRLEKTEELFASSSEKQEETQRDTQSTDRFELKREAESVIKQDLAVNANAAVTYTYGAGMIVANVTAGMAYTRSQTDQNKAADNFSREVLDKAVKRIQSRASEQRSTTKLFETEETNTHTLANPAGNGGHISGIYRWLDKEYRAQLFNYGRRLMYEFIVPEPAAFFVEARLRAYEGQIDVPTPPTLVKPKPAELDFLAEKIDRKKFNELRLRYDLTDLSYPVIDKTVTFKESKTGQAVIEGEIIVAKAWQPKSFTCDLRSKGYDITALMVEGTLQFNGEGAVDRDPKYDVLRNLFRISINGEPVFYMDYGLHKYHSFHTPNIGLDNDLNDPLKFPVCKLMADEVDLVIGTQNAQHFNLEVSARLKFSVEALAEWQQKVYERVIKIEQEKFDDLQRAVTQTYQAQMATYRNRLAELRTMAVNELLQGQSDAFNRQLIARELKRLCLASLTKDFDADAADDVTTKMEAMGKREEKFTYRQLKVTELPDAAAPVSVEVEFEILDKTIGYPAPELGMSAVKARYIQFLEQAFDWQQMAYLFYPYFWATPMKWIELMSRGDAADANMSAFLQAGSCKVLLAVTPAYDDAVMHYLATGEPWEGGPAPVIGDPLYIPLYEEIRKQQDDLDGAVPEGASWKFTVPTSLVYLENSSTPLPKSVCDP
jgi:hypothetical protein